MNSFWVLAAILAVFPLVAMMFHAVRYRRSRGSQTVRTAWLVGATTTGAMLVFICATVNDLIPKSTVVDVAALAVTGILTGFFLALGLWPADSQNAKT